LIFQVGGPKREPSDLEDASESQVMKSKKEDSDVKEDSDAKEEEIDKIFY